MALSLVQNLTSIKQLHLSSVAIGSTVPNTLVNLSSLTSLCLQGCNLKGQFPAGIFHLPNLQVLDLSLKGYLNGYFPDDLNTSCPLKILNLQYTNFSGHIPASIGNLRALNLLNIASCLFYPSVPSSLSNLTQLNFLDLSYFYEYTYQPYLPIIHTFSGQVSDSWSGRGELTKLYSLVLQDTNLRGDLPSSLSNLTRLLELDLRQNQISGDVPHFLANLTQLSILLLSDNQITGEVPCSLANLTQLTVLDLSQNQISEIPSCLVQLTQLTQLDLRNNLQGEIPRSLFELRNLESMYLHSNNLSGYVEFNEFSKLEKLSVLHLSLNKLSVQFKTGFIPPKLKILGLGSCNLTEFPEFLSYSSKLRYLDLSENNLHGQIPKWMWNSTSETMLILNLSHNHLTGVEGIPVIIPWHGLSVLALDSNMLRGSLPIPTLLMGIYSVSNNEYAGEIPKTFCKTEILYILDLSNNNLNGTIPQCFENLCDLESAEQFFSGGYPSTMFKHKYVVKWD